MVASDEQRVLVLIEESKVASQNAQARYATFFQIAAASVVLVPAVAGITSGIAQRFIVVGIPLILCVLAGCLAMLLTDVIALGVYQQYIQSELVALTDVNLRYHEVLNNRPLYSVAAVQASIFLVIVLSFVLSGYNAYTADTYRGALAALFWTSLVFGLLLLVVSALDVLRAEENAKTRLVSDSSTKTLGAAGIR